VTLRLASWVLVTVHIEPETLTVNDDELPQKQVGGPPGWEMTQQVSRAGVDVPQQEQTAAEMSDNTRSLASGRRMAWRPSLAPPTPHRQAAVGAPVLQRETTQQQSMTSPGTTAASVVHEVDLGPSSAYLRPGGARGP
jgi:hypothetical protein